MSVLATGALALAVLAPGAAHAQCVIPDEIVTAVQMSADAEAQLTRCAQENARDLTSPDPARRRAARQALTRPLDNPGVSAAFRLRYGAALREPLVEAIGNPDERIAINAMVLCGEIATDPALAILMDHLGSPRPALRYDAAYAVRRTFIALQRSVPAIQPDQVNRTLATLRTRAAAEQDGLVLQAHVAAFLEGAALPADRFPQARAAGVRALCEGLGEHAKAAGSRVVDPSVLDAYVRGATGVRDILAQPSANLDAQTARAAGELGGRLIAYAVRVVKDKSLSPGAGPARDQVSEAVAVGQTLVQLAARSLNPNASVAGAPLGPLVKSGDVQSEARFLLDAQNVVGPTGTLATQPFNFARDHFLP